MTRRLDDERESIMDWFDPDRRDTRGRRRFVRDLCDLTDEMADGVIADPEEDPDDEALPNARRKAQRIDWGCVTRRRDGEDE